MTEEAGKELIERRKKQVSAFFKKSGWIYYLLLAIVVFIAVRIRTRNLDGLRDVTTGSWTLGPDLDPFLFLRWAKYIVENGSLMAIDTFRYVPLGFETKGELILLPYMMAWFHKIAVFFGSISVEQSSVIFPVVMFALTVVAFFLFVRKLFVSNLGKKNANIIAIIASLFLTISPSLLFRTIAGIPEKESAAFFFMFMAFYLFLSSWETKKKYSGYLLAILAGLFSAAMALIWGGFIFVFFTIGPFILVNYILGKLNKERLYIGLIFVASSIIAMAPFSTRYSILGILTSTMIMLILWVLVAALLELYFGRKIDPYFERGFLKKIPKKILYLVSLAVVGIVVLTVIFGPSFIVDNVNSVVKPIIRPIADRFGVTVAENRQPYFSEWASNFGPSVKGIPITFWLMIIASVYLFNNTLKVFRKKERYILSAGFLIFIITMIFGRYSPQSVLNGTSFASIAFYSIGFLVFITPAIYYYNKKLKEDRESLSQIDSSKIFIILLLIIGIVSARGSVRTIMLLVPAASILIGYLVVRIWETSKQVEDKNKKITYQVAALIVLCLLVFSAYQLYLISNGSAQSFVPSVYNQQWQYAMSWVRDNTPENSVFGHWWDYGYWVQSIGERATVLDGGNALGYWNHLMGRHALTGSDNRLALEFLYAHNTTHFLIDSTDIGKYTAFSSIGSNESYDRRSWINTFVRDNTQIFESKNRTRMLYVGGALLDEDIIYQKDSEVIFLPGINDQDVEKVGNVAGIGGVILDMESNGQVAAVSAVFVYQGNQYEIPLKYAHHNGILYEFNDGIEAGVFIMPSIGQNSAGYQIEEGGALLFLTKRTVNSQLARLYLYSEENPNFKLVHSEDDSFIKYLKAQNIPTQEFVYFQGGVRGPIKIWEITYPADIKFKEEYLQIESPENIRRL